MFFSKIITSRQALASGLLPGFVGRDGYGVHKLLWRFFADSPNRSRDFLYRYDQGNGLGCFYLVSAREPGPVEGFEVQTKPYAPRLRQGQSLRFSLRANPVVCRKVDGRKNSQRHDVLMDEKKDALAQGLSPAQVQERVHGRALAWLQERSAACGFQLQSETVRLDSYNQHRFDKGGKSVRFSSLDYNGILNVRDASLLLQTLRAGLGKSKGFGCGLMLIKPCREDFF